MVACYIGADGPTIRVDIQQRADLQRLVDSAHELLTGAAENDISITSLFPVAFDGLSELWLSRDEGTGWMRKSIFRAISASGQLLFCWSATREGWYQNEGLLESLGEGPGHQYLSSGEHDDALLVIAFREPRVLPKKDL